MSLREELLRDLWNSPFGDVDTTEADVARINALTTEPIDNSLRMAVVCVKPLDGGLHVIVGGRNFSPEAFGQITRATVSAYLESAPLCDRRPRT